MNERFINALQHRPQKVPPIWFMRQAGRYHSHYRALRERHSFIELCKNPELACEVTMGPIREFDYDVAILFSDLLFPLEALGFPLNYDKGPPELGWKLTKDSLSQFKPLESAVQQLDFQKQALQQIRSALPTNKSLIGFIGGPFTLFTYALGAEKAERLFEAKSQFGLFQQFCELLIPLLRNNIELQIAGGAEVVMIFESTGGSLSPFQYEQYCIPAIKNLSAGFESKVAYYLRESTETHVLEVQKALPDLAGIGVDHRFNLASLLARHPRGFLQGNFDQALLFLDKDSLKKELALYLRPLLQLPPESRCGWVCGVGHGVLPKTPEDNVKIFIDEVRKAFSA